MLINQTVVNEWILIGKGYVVAKGKEVAQAHKSSDRLFSEKLDELMALENFLYSIRNYDYLSAIFTDDELKHLFEQIGKLGYTCPKSWLTVS